MPKLRTDHLNIFARGKMPHESFRKYEINASSEDETDVLIYDVIAWYAVDAAQLARDLQKITTPRINLRINSPGGNVFDGLAIHNMLKAHPATITTHIEGYAASIASIIALAGDTVKIAKNAFFMIHEPWSIIAGDAEELRKEADVLDKLSGALVSTYLEVSGKSEKQIKAWMKEETWFNAQAAVDSGFAHEIIGESSVNAGFDVSIFANVPDELRERINATRSKPTEREIEKILRESGFSRKEAVSFVSGGMKTLSSQRDSEPDWSSYWDTVNRTIQLMKG